jgi:hypothetical protein
MSSGAHLRARSVSDGSSSIRMQMRIQFTKSQAGAEPSIPRPVVHTEVLEVDHVDTNGPICAPETIVSAQLALPWNFRRNHTHRSDLPTLPAP